MHDTALVISQIHTHKIMHICFICTALIINQIEFVSKKLLYKLEEACMDDVWIAFRVACIVTMICIVRILVIAVIYRPLII